VENSAPHSYRATREIRLSDLVEGGFLGVGDILVYRRTFSLANVTVEKDIMVRFLYSELSTSGAHNDDDKRR